MGTKTIQLLAWKRKRNSYLLSYRILLGSFIAKLRSMFDFHGCVVNNTQRQAQSSQGHDAEGFALASDDGCQDRVESKSIINVLRQFPRKSRIMAAVRHAASAFLSTPCMQPHEEGLIKERIEFVCGSVCATGEQGSDVFNDVDRGRAAVL